jgi:hypothetical protein
MVRRTISSDEHRERPEAVSPEAAENVICWLRRTREHG